MRRDRGHRAGQRLHGRPAPRPLRHRGAAGPLPARARSPASRSPRSRSPSRAPARTSPACQHGRDRPSTAATGSTAPRCSSPTPASPTCSIVAAKTDPAAGTTGSPRSWSTPTPPGCRSASRWRKMGWHASDTREVILRGLLRRRPTRCSASEGRGFHQIMDRLPARAGLLAGMGLGHAAECLDARHRLRRGAGGVRRAAGQSADDPPPAGRDVDRAGGGPAAHLPGRRPAGRRPPGRRADRGDGQVPGGAGRQPDRRRGACSSSAATVSSRRRRSPGTTATRGSCESAAARTRSSWRSWPRGCDRK